MYPGIELRLYRYVAVLAEELNFTHAALRLHVSQPTLSTQIRDLEREIGVNLFERNKGGQHVTLTDAGEAFAAEARHTLFRADRAIEGARAARDHHKGTWNLGYSPLIDLRIVAKVRQHLSAGHPAMNLRLLSGHTSEQAEGLMRGKLQAGLVILPMRRNGLTFELVHREALVLALPKEHPLAAKAHIEITDLHELPLVTLRGDIEPRFGEDLMRIFGMTRISPQILHQATTQPEALEIVAQSNVAALILPSAQRPLQECIVFRRFADELLAAETALAYLEDGASPILKSLRRFLCETFQPLAAGNLCDTQFRQMKLF